MNQRPNPSRGTKLLRSFATVLRAKVSGLTFEQAPELFKDIESIKARIRHREGLVPRHEA